MPTLAQLVARNVRLLREARRWRRKDLAFVALISESYVEKIERGRKVPTLETLEYIARALHIDPKYLAQDLEGLTSARRNR